MRSVAQLNQVCGIIVTYNPGSGFAENIARVSPQLEFLVVVDNGSRADVLESIRELSIRFHFTLLELGHNFGIATALNRGVAWAHTQNASWVALFDQDSSAEANMVAALRDAYITHSVKQNIAIVSAKHMMHDTGNWMKPVCASDGGPLVAITSGSLMPLSIFEACGVFEEDLIIDRVDEEYCLRVRTLGYSIVLCEAAVLWVTLGSPKPFQLFGKTLFSATHYSPARRYYNTRNRLIIVKRHWRLYPRWCCWVLTGFVKEILMLSIAEQQRMHKLRNVALGIRDALFNRLGMVVPL